MAPGDRGQEALWQALEHNEYDTETAGPHIQKVDFPTDAKLFLGRYISFECFS